MVAKIIHDKRTIKILLILLIISLLFFSSSLAFYVYKTGKNQVPVQDQIGREPTVGLDLKEVLPPQDTNNVLLLGHGDPGHPGGDLADTLVVVRLDTKNQAAALISVPRDTWLSVRLDENQVEPHKINEVYLVGKQFKDEEFGFQLIKQAVGEVVGLPIHHYVFINFGKFMELIDGLGGIEVEVPVSFDDHFYPIRGRELEICDWRPEEVAAMTATMSGFLLEKQFTCRYERLHFEKGKVQMNGETALKFVRSRHSDQHGGDFARAERQQAVLLGIAEKLFSLDVFNKAPKFFKQFTSLVKTDIDLKTSQAVVDLVVGPSEYGVAKIVLSTDNVFDSSRNFRGQFVLIPKAGADQWGEINRFIREILETPLNAGN